MMRNLFYYLFAILRPVETFLERAVSLSFSSLARGIAIFDSAVFEKHIIIAVMGVPRIFSRIVVLFVENGIDRSVRCVSKSVMFLGDKIRLLQNGSSRLYIIIAIIGFFLFFYLSLIIWGA